jgi:RNA polymerase sigma-70 factor, ECF subfamily
MQHEVEQQASDRAPGGEIDHDAFTALAEPHRRALMTHCYRMMGSLEEAEDMVQETLARAWRGRGTYQGRASFKAWLYRIATNLCLDALKQRLHRSLPVARDPAASIDEPVPAALKEPVWLEPFPDALLADDENPEAHLATRERISLAFMISLHLLPPRQRAVLILRDVLDMPAHDVAELLDGSVPAVKSALHRARTTLAAQQRRHLEPLPPKLDERLREQLERYVRAWESADVEGLMALLKEDASFSMPPIPSWYQGRDTIGRLVANTVFRGPAAGRWRLVPTRANGRTAFGLYRLDDAGVHSIYGIQVVTFDGDAIADITTCINPRLARFFGLPEKIEAES